VQTRTLLVLPLLFGALAFVEGAAAVGDARTAALQVALRAQGLYRGTIDGVQGPGTTRAIRRLQRRARLVVDGVAGPRTLRALGRLGRPALGRRPLRLGRVGRDVAELQFKLAEHGFPSGAFDGVLGARTDWALRRFQHWAGLRSDGVAGPATLIALAGPLPQPTLPLAWPLRLPVGDPFGPRAGGRFHTGIDLPAPTGTPVHAAARGRVSWAAYMPGGWGNLVVVADGHGVRTLYAHLSRISVHVGERVAVGSLLGLVGATGDATGPHLHFQVNVRGAAVDPVPALR
jgi:murein DD-endopeptidase MepM/ murein hydrolase activator NlpD